MRTTTLFAGFIVLVLVGAACSRQVTALPTMAPSDAFTNDSMEEARVAQDAGMENGTEGSPADKMADQSATARGSASGAGLDGDDTAMKGKLQPSAVPYYITYSDSELTKAVQAKKAVLLYFWAGWCPICRAEEPKVQATVESSGLNVAGFRVNFDTEEALKTKHRVPYQHTTIILNTRGEESARFSGPTDAAVLLEALRKASQV